MTEPMTNPGNWPDPLRPGEPLNRDQSGAHLIAWNDDAQDWLLWDHVDICWVDTNQNIWFPKEINANGRYLGPAHPPGVEFRAARQQAIDEVRGWIPKHPNQKIEECLRGLLMMVRHRLEQLPPPTDFPDPSAGLAARVAELEAKLATAEAFVESLHVEITGKAGTGSTQFDCGGIVLAHITKLATARRDAFEDAIECACEALVADRSEEAMHRNDGVEQVIAAIRTLIRNDGGEEG